MYRWLVHDVHRAKKHHTTCLRHETYHNFVVVGAHLVLPSTIDFLLFGNCMVSNSVVFAELPKAGLAVAF